MIEKIKQISFPKSEIFNNKKIALSINLFNRVDGFETYVDAINSCDELENIPIFIYIDGGKNAKQQELIEKCKLIKFKHKYVIKRGDNYGCERGFIDIFNKTLIDLEFDYMFFLEDDLIVSKNYFKHCFDSFFKIKEKIDSNIGIYQGYSFCLMSKEEKQQNLDKFILAEMEQNVGLWAFMMSKDAWLKIKNVLVEYEKICETLPTNGYSHHSVVTTHRPSFINSFNNIIEKYNLINNPIATKYFYKKEKEHCIISVDGAIALALLASGVTRYRPIVNRCISIGSTGVHFTREAFKQMKLDKMNLDIF